ncbi:hypothetical protein ACFQT0_10200 [Hymenobacter humi]|uniref:Uncharacterized protein n=1 Tax=Hymenobacter humi TaxID=1411620 RepID=A0ABW2U4A1_9BACT
MNNYYKPGPITPLDKPISFRILKPEASRDKALGQVYGQAYVAGNIIEGNEKITKDNWAGGVQLEDVAEPEKILAGIRLNEPLPFPHVTVVPALEAYRFVLANVGATLPRRDAVDARIVEEVRTGKIVYAKDAKPSAKSPYIKRRLPEDSYKMGIITDPAQVGGYPVYKGTPYKDSDHDGLPDAWETKHGLDPKSAADATQDRDKDGYTNIEEFLDSVVNLQTVRPTEKRKS